MPKPARSSNGLVRDFAHEIESQTKVHLFRKDNERSKSLKTYPEVITPEILASNESISNEDILRDIADTEREILVEKNKAEAYRLLASSGTDVKMSTFRHSAALSAIADRSVFVEFLRKLLEAREQK